MHRLEATASPECLDDVHALLARVWADAPEVPEAARTRITIAVAELVGNVIEHGRTASGGAPLIRLALAVEPQRVVATLEDDGVGYPPEGRLPDDEMAESGRGLALVYSALDEVAYARREDGNRWDLVVHR